MPLLLIDWGCELCACLRRSVPLLSWLLGGHTQWGFLSLDEGPEAECLNPPPSPVSTVCVVGFSHPAVRDASHRALAVCLPGALSVGSATIHSLNPHSAQRRKLSLERRGRGTGTCLRSAS